MVSAGQDKQVGRPTDLARSNQEPAHLIRRRFAVTASRHTSDQPALRIHPDVLFALQLADKPAPA